LLAAPAARAAEAIDPFYVASPEELRGAPGTLIRSEPMEGAPLAAAAWRILYRSTDPAGAPIAVSGVAVIPRTPPPAGGRPIVAWAHPTSGLVQHCAPSLANFVFQQMSGLRDMMEHGYIVAATDYPGLGTEGVHPYLVGDSEARAVLDSARAARALPAAEAGSRVGLWGHSQGGQAVLFAGIIGRSYAPDLDIVGVAAAAPATELGALLIDDFARPGGKNLLAMTLWSWSRIYDIPLNTVVDPAAMPAIDRLAKQCIESPVDIEPRARIAKELEQRFLIVDNLVDREPWLTWLRRNTVGTLPPSLPVFLAQGLDDTTVDPPVTLAYMKRLCAAGSRVDLLELPDVGHALVGAKASRPMVDWMAARFAGEPAPDDC
ncbi:MAG TPA: alpha/beta fold hydrolase, partial [Bauldia sp.]|nr:alpha/beta fold hydrolase [Bauldia sp.]